MIGSLRGMLLARSDGEALVEVGGVGYRIVLAPTTSVGLGELGTEVLVHVHHHVREDAEVLYGFDSLDERTCFEALLGAHGVGPALALAILGVHPPASLARVLADDDIAALCLVPGVGKKTATRLLVELKSRLDLPLGDTVPGADPASGLGGGPRDDVRDALAGLGYGPDEVAEALRDLDDADGLDAEELLRRALQKLAVRS